LTCFQTAAARFTTITPFAPLAALAIHRTARVLRAAKSGEFRIKKKTVVVCNTYQQMARLQSVDSLKPVHPLPPQIAGVLTSRVRDFVPVGELS
jgi:hypothetical protein